MAQDHNRQPGASPDGARVHELDSLQEQEYLFPYHHVSRFRGDFSQCFNDTWGINYLHTIEFLLQELATERFDTLVDIGCGDGRLTKEIAHEFPDALVGGVDSSPRAIEFAKAFSPDLDFNCIDLIEFEANRKFDGALLIEVFEHIPHDQAPGLLEGVAKTLKPEAFLLVTVPHSNKPLEYKHYRHFTSEQLEQAFQPHFTLEKLVPFEQGSWQRRLVNRILSNRFVILNHRLLKNLLYSYTRDHLFFATERDCQRIYAKFRLKAKH
ncbi:class I SAM-dependent methyltransferase [Pseudomonadota bacterium]